MNPTFLERSRATLELQGGEVVVHVVERAAPMPEALKNTVVFGLGSVFAGWMLVSIVGPLGWSILLVGALLPALSFRHATTLLRYSIHIRPGRVVVLGDRNLEFPLHPDAVVEVREVRVEVKHGQTQFWVGAGLPGPDLDILAEALRAYAAADVGGEVPDGLDRLRSERD